MERTNKIYIVLLVVGALVYAVVIPLHWSEGYIDFGDGNYLYISWRMANGVVLYRDVMAPQPPIHLCLGSALMRLAKAAGLPSLYTVRAFSLLLHLATFLLIYILSLRIFQRRPIATLSALVYLIIPVGFWWSLGYQSEPTEIFFLLLAVYFFLNESRGSLILSALFSTLAVFTNMTAAPYVLFTAFYAIVRRRKVCYYYVVPLFGLCFIGVLLAETLTGAYLSNVIFNQVGTFPKKAMSEETVIQYALRKIASEGKDVLVWEGGIIVLAVLGLFVFIRCSEHPLKEYIAWFSFFSWCSIIYVSKGGTMDYIFTLGEPYVAIMSAYFLYWFSGHIASSVKEASSTETERKRTFFDTTALLRLILYGVLCVVVFGIGLRFIVATLQERTFELPEDGVKKIKYYIRRYTQPGDTILSPSFYAFITQRKIIEDYSEIFIWTIKYWNERIVERRPGEGVQKVEKIADAIKKRRLPLLILDMRQTGKIPEIRRAIQEHYRPLLEEPFQTLNTPLQFYIPRESE
ncbi:glycosyltransferase family 39 protein [Candidatus Sumerlaeota bacterium]|nr:glycosyltransferase family 39 protein [Candidatus Sumerlaeota bacterium]